MDVKPGYKQTDVGMIPKDWEVTPLGSFCEIVAGRDLVKADYSPTDDQRHQYPIYSNALTNKGLYGYSKSYQYEPDRITVTARGDIGHAAYRSTKFCAIGRLVVLSCKRACDLRFVTEFINNVVDFALESTGVPQLTAPQISKYAVALPPTKAEQEAIAETLSDADALIESLEQLIAKKRHLKQGAMQELLTGRRRLPGFSRTWELRRFGEIAQLRTERMDPRRTGVQKFCVELEHIEQGTGCLVGYTATGGGSSLKSVFLKDDVLFGKLRAYLRKYWLANQDGVCSTEIWMLAAKPSLLIPVFLFQVVKVDRFVEAAGTS